MTHERDNMPNEDAERTARHLDGHRGPLDPDQAGAADEIRRVEGWLGSLLDVAVPQEVLDKAYRKLDAALTRQTQPRRWRFWAVAASSAVAAAVAIAVLLNALVPTVQPAPLGLAEATEEVDAFLGEDASALGLQLALLDDEFTLTWAEWVLDEEFGETSAMDAIEQGLDDLLFADPMDASDNYEL